MSGTHNMHGVLTGCLYGIACRYLPAKFIFCTSSDDFRVIIQKAIDGFLCLACTYVYVPSLQ